MTDHDSSVLNAEPGVPAAPSVAWPEGAAIIERIGWEDREENEHHAGGPAFTATLTFPNGAPQLTVAAVFQKLPVKLELIAPQPELVSDRATSNTDAAQVPPSGTPIAGGGR